MARQFATNLLEKRLFSVVLSNKRWAACTSALPVAAALEQGGCFVRPGSFFQFETIPTVWRFDTG